MATQVPGPEDGDRPEGPMPDVPDTDEKKRQGPDEVRDPPNPDRLGGGRPAGVPGERPGGSHPGGSPDTKEGGAGDPSTGGQSGAAQPRGDEPARP